jgi:excisionase family DNA binding protein
VKLTIKQAAERAGVSPSLVYGWCQERRLRHYRFGGKGRRGKIMVEEFDLEGFLEECVVEPGEADEDGPLTHIR